MDGSKSYTSGVCKSGRECDARHGRLLEYFTLGCNLLEAVIAIAAGVSAGSIALIGFGIDSLIESFSGAVLLWRLQVYEADEEREHLAIKLVGISFLLLAAYVCFDAVKALVLAEGPDESWIGIALAIASLIIMPILARAKRRVAARLESRSLEADSHQTDLCAYLSAILLAGLALNSLLGWWWADPIAALIMVPIIAREGVGILRGDSCAE